MLLVDDDSTAILHQSLLTRTLGVTQQVLVADSGQQALAQLEAAAPDSGPQLILLGLNMPVINGWEFLTAYQQLPVAGTYSALYPGSRRKFTGDDGTRAI